MKKLVYSITLIVGWLLFLLFFGVCDFNENTSIILVFIILFIIAIIIICLPNIYNNYIKSKHNEEMDRLIRNSNISVIDDMSPYDFEEFVAQIYRKKGYTAQVTPSSNDYGVDIILIRNDIRIGVQVKKYNQNVGVKAVQEVIAGMMYYNCSKGIVVTSATDFTKQAKNLAIKSNVELINYYDLAKILNEYK